jgi:hypothetical protein
VPFDRYGCDGFTWHDAARTAIARRQLFEPGGHCLTILTGPRRNTGRTGLRRSGRRRGEGRSWQGEARGPLPDAPRGP